MSENLDPKKQNTKNGMGAAPSKSPAPVGLGRFLPDEKDVERFLSDLFSKDGLISYIKGLRRVTRTSVRDLCMQVFYAKERILCGVVVGFLMVLFALLQTTIFSTIRPFGAIPDFMLIFVLALSVTEGRKWGAVWGIIAAVVIESLGSSDVTLLPLLYMPVGFFCGALCQNYYTGSFAVRTVMTLSVIPFRGLFTAVYMILSPLDITAAEVLLDVVLPEAVGTLVIAIPIHLIIYFCMKPFHHTRAEMVSGK